MDSGSRAMIDDRQISKTLSHALRHEPWLYELELDDEGWTPLEAVLAALRAEREAWRALCEQDIARMMASSDKRRYEVSGGRIRALYGHSIARRLKRIQATPPAQLFHGTSPKAARAIGQSGLLPMGRQYVHCSADVPTARQVGRRKAADPVILTIRAGEAHDRGVAFYIGNEMVWLADAVPAEFIDFPGVAHD